MDERSECEKPSLSGPEFLPHFAEGNIVKGFGRGSRELGRIIYILREIIRIIFLQGPNLMNCIGC